MTFFLINIVHFCCIISENFWSNWKYLLEFPLSLIIYNPLLKYKLLICSGKARINFKTFVHDNILVEFWVRFSISFRFFVLLALFFLFFIHDETFCIVVGSVNIIYRWEGEVHQNQVLINGRQGLKSNLYIKICDPVFHRFTRTVLNRRVSQ